MNIDAFVREHGMIPSGGRILCAVSGGADSVCLLSVLRESAPHFGAQVCCAHFNHMLRGAESDRDEDFVRRLCQAWDVEFICGRGDVAAYAAQHGLGTEESGRILRYRFLESAADKLGCDRIATAHNANDNAETVLLNLARGSGARGLCGIPPVRGRIIRPMLETTRSQIDEYLSRRCIEHVEDSTNRDEGYTRNYVRHNIIPLLARVNPGCVENISRMSLLLREDEEYLCSLAEKFIEENLDGGSLPAAKLLELPRPVSARVLREIWNRSLTETHIDALLDLCRDGKSGAFADIPGGRVAREFDRLVFSRHRPGRIETAVISPGGTTDLGCGMEAVCEIVEAPREVNSSLNTFFFKCENICGKIIVRPREPGDKIRILGRGCTKSLKKLFAEAGVPRGERDAVPVLADEKGVIAVCGFGVCERCAVNPGDKAVKIQIRGKSCEKRR